MSVALALAAILAIRNEAFAASGLGYLIYLLHDWTWLPVYSAVWVAPFPYGLLWAVPTAFVALFCSLEFLGLGSPVRNVQVRLVKSAIIGRFARFLAVPLIAHARWFQARNGSEPCITVAVLWELRAEARTRTLDGDRGGLEDLCRVQDKIAAIFPDDRAEAVSTLETVAFAYASGIRCESRLVRRLEKDWPGLAELASRWKGARESDPRGATRVEYPEVVDALTRNLKSMQAEDAALQSIGCVLAGIGRGPAVLTWFDAWAVARYSGKEDRSELALAEEKIAFEYWAHLAEDTLETGRVDETLADAIDWREPVRERGEAFAYGVGRLRPGEAA